MVTFGVVACLFNPIVPIGFSTAPAMVLNTITLLLFGLYLKLLKTPPRLSIASITPLLDPLRSDPRFQELLRRIGLPS